jgi:glycosyltransferase involved in cell wall biosynthesis
VSRVEPGRGSGAADLTVLHVLASAALAGIERHVLGLVSEQRRLGCAAEIVCPASATAVRREAARLGIPLRSARRAIRDARTDIVHVHDGRSALFGVLSSQLSRCAFVRTQHFVLSASAARHGMIRDASLAMHRRINARVNGYICVSAAVADAVAARRDAEGTRIVIIAPGVQLATPTAVEQAVRRRAQTARSCVVTAGRIEPERRMDVLVEAIPQVRRVLPDCQFVIVGMGRGEPELWSLARRLGVEDAITWTGWLNDIEPVLASGHAYVNTWPLEGFGMATAEAMGYALPVVVADTGASPELVEPGVTGTIVRSADPASLADALCELLSDRPRAAAMGNAARSRAVNAYSVRATALAVVDFYQELLGTGAEQ